MAQRQGRDRRHVRALGAVGNAVPDPRNHRTPMASLAVDQDQRVVGGQAPEVRGTHDPRRVARGLGVDVVRRHHRAEQVAQVGVALVGELSPRDGVDRHHGLGRGSRTGPASHGHHALQGNGRRGQEHVQANSPAGDDHDLATFQLIADRSKLDLVGPRGHAGHLIASVRLGCAPHAGLHEVHLGSRQRSSRGRVPRDALEPARRLARQAVGRRSRQHQGQQRAHDGPRPCFNGPRPYFQRHP